MEAVAKAFGANVRKPGGSHVIFEHAAVMTALSVPARRKIKAVYVGKFVEWIDSIRGPDEEEA